MKAIQHLLAIAALATATTASATAVASFNITLTDNYALDSYSSSGIGNGTALLDSSGLLTVQTIEHDLIYSSGIADPIYDLTINKTNIYSGIFNGVTFTPSSGILNNSSCFDNFTHLACAGLIPLGIDYPFITVSGQVSIDVGGILNGTFPTVDNGVNYLVTTFTPTVPVPAAAWLFGSGLIGLGGITRRKSKII